MFAAPDEGTLKDFMEFGDTGCADHEQAPPNQRTHSAEHYTKLTHRKGRYGRFRHVGSLPKTHLLPRTLTPKNLPLSFLYRFEPGTNTPYLAMFIFFPPNYITTSANRA